MVDKRPDDRSARGALALCPSGRRSARALVAADLRLGRRATAAARGSAFEGVEPGGEALVFRPRRGGHRLDRVEFVARDQVPAATPPAAIKVLRDGTRIVVASPEFKSAMEKMDTPIQYLDAPEFQKFWDQDADRLIRAIRNIGKVQ